VSDENADDDLLAGRASLVRVQDWDALRLHDVQVEPVWAWTSQVLTPNMRLLEQREQSAVLRNIWCAWGEGPARVANAGV